MGRTLPARWRAPHMLAQPLVHILPPNIYRPPAEALQALHEAGQRASASGVMGGQIRTDADLDVLLQICIAVGGEGP